MIDVTISSIDDEIEGEKLKANIVVRKDYKDSLTGEVIKKQCSEHLALFKIPQVYDIKDNLTITATGKKIKKLHPPK